jgi:hypothetical protein
VQHEQGCTDRIFNRLAVSCAHVRRLTPRGARAGERSITEQGFQFLLLDTYGQLWLLLREYIASVDARFGARPRAPLLRGLRCLPARSPFNLGARMLAAVCEPQRT